MTVAAAAVSSIVLSYLNIKDEGSVSFAAHLQRAYFAAKKAYFVFCFLHFVIEMNKTRTGGAGKRLRASAHVLRTAGLANISFFPYILEVGVADEYIQTPSYKHGHEA